MVHLFTFACRNAENIQRGIEAKKWAVATVSDRSTKARRTKAKKYLELGARGLLYCNPLQSFTTPFLVTSEPELYSVEQEVWPEAWSIPFGIQPLGDLSKTLNKDEARNRWSFLAHRMSFDGYNSVSAAMNFTGATVFSPLSISDQDWDCILSDLSTS